MSVYRAPAGTAPRGTPSRRHRSWELVKQLSGWDLLPSAPASPAPRASAQGPTAPLSPAPASAATQSHAAARTHALAPTLSATELRAFNAPNNPRDTYGRARSAVEIRQDYAHASTTPARAVTPEPVVTATAAAPPYLKHHGKHQPVFTPAIAPTYLPAHAHPPAPTPTPTPPPRSNPFALPTSAQEQQQQLEHAQHAQAHAQYAQAHAHAHPLAAALEHDHLTPADVAQQLDMFAAANQVRTCFYAECVCMHMLSVSACTC